ncbi:TPA: hypothetical protein VBB13_001174 [Streptococcus agalactiae]|nr:hypothetical protein [Streptococcus agalactiae]
MIDRSYLPFPDAQLYQDRKMAKWMGFFLSEHTSALVEDVNSINFFSDLSLEQKLLLLSQVYANQLPTHLTVRDKNRMRHLVGTIPTLTRDNIIIKTTDGHISVSLVDILSIELAEEDYHESA